MRSGLSLRESGVSFHDPECDWPWEIVTDYVPEEKHKELFDKIMEAEPRRAAPSPAISLRDAIDYLHWIVYSTIKYYRHIGFPLCGGKVEVASVTSDRGFRWVTHKSLDWTIGDHEGQTEYSPRDPHKLGR